MTLPPRRTWRWRALVAGGTLLSGCLLAAFVLAATGLFHFNRIERVELPESAQSGGEAQSFLLVGSDSRAFVSNERQAESFGTTDDVSSARADTILLVRLFPQEDRAAVVSFPRDLWVDIPGHGPDRINAAFAGGPALLAATIHRNFGIPVDHYVQVDFEGFRRLVDANGGVTIHLDTPVRDFDEDAGRTMTGLEILTTGEVTLDGDDALAYVRSRHFQQLVDGEWQTAPSGDLGRIQRQQDFLQRALDQTIDAGLLNPMRLRQLLAFTGDHVSLDEDLGTFDLLALVDGMRDVTSEAVTTYTLPMRPGETATGAQVLFLDEAAANPVFAVFRGEHPVDTGLLPSAVRVGVRSAPGWPITATAAAFRLSALGFDVTGVSRAAAQESSAILHAPGEQAAAALVAAQLRSPLPVHEDASLLGEGVDVVVIVGDDFPGVPGPPQPPR